MRCGRPRSQGYREWCAAKLPPRLRGGDQSRQRSELGLYRQYILDEWEFYDDLEALEGPKPGFLLSGSGFSHAGHHCSTLLDDGAILTVHNNYLTMGMTLIRWRP